MAAVLFRYRTHLSTHTPSSIGYLSAILGQYVSADESGCLLLSCDFPIQLRFCKWHHADAPSDHVSAVEYIGRRAVLSVLAVGCAISSAKANRSGSLAHAGNCNLGAPT